MPESKYPEHEKLTKIKDESQTIGEFLEWFQHEKKVTACVKHKHDDSCYSKSGYSCCSFRVDEYAPFPFLTEVLLAEYFKIDLNKIEKEKRQMLDKIKKVNNKT